MATPAHSTEGAARPIEHSCGICSTELCCHLICRTCGTCEQCKAAEDVYAVPAAAAHQHRYPFSIVRLSAERVSSLPFDLQRRAEYLESIGIAAADIADASRSLDELRADGCICGRRKRQYDSFCRNCYQALPASLRPNLNLHLQMGYLKYVREAWQLLAAARVTTEPTL
jgi:hypothetical protein